MCQRTGNDDCAEEGSPAVRDASFMGEVMASGGALKPPVARFCRWTPEASVLLGKRGGTAGTEAGLTVNRRSESGAGGSCGVSVSSESCEDGSSFSSGKDDKGGVRGVNGAFCRVGISSMRGVDRVSRGLPRMAQTAPKESPATIRNTRNPRSTRLVRVSHRCQQRHPCRDHNNRTPQKRGPSVTFPKIFIELARDGSAIIARVVALPTNQDISP